MRNMREIKFRAWNGKRMDCGGCDCVLRSEPEAKIMQFTGLKDKNEKEIYEGDIVRFISPSFYSGGDGIIEFEAGEYVARRLATKEKGSLAYLWFSEDADTSIGYTSKNEREILGNIYENPDLIK